MDREAEPQAPQAAQQEPAGPGPSSEAALAAAAFAPKRSRNRGNIRKRPAEGEDDEDAAGAGGQEGAVRPAAKAARAGGDLAFTNKQERGEEVHVTYQSSMAIQSGKDTRVTSMLETETDVKHDARCVRARGCATPRRAWRVLAKQALQHTHGAKAAQAARPARARPAARPMRTPRAPCAPAHPPRARPACTPACNPACTRCTPACTPQGPARGGAAPDG